MYAYVYKHCLNRFVGWGNPCKS